MTKKQRCPDEKNGLRRNLNRRQDIEYGRREYLDGLLRKKRQRQGKGHHRIRESIKELSAIQVILRQPIGIRSKRRIDHYSGPR